MGRKVLVMKGCGTCETLKKNGMCKSESCIDVSTKTGIQLVKVSRTKNVPQCITTNKKGKIVKCNTNPIIRKFSKKKK